MRRWCSVWVRVATAAVLGSGLFDGSTLWASAYGKLGDKLEPTEFEANFRDILTTTFGIRHLVVDTYVVCRVWDRYSERYRLATLIPGPQPESVRYHFLGWRCRHDDDRFLAPMRDRSGKWVRFFADLTVEMIDEKLIPTLYSDLARTRHLLWGEGQRLDDEDREAFKRDLSILKGLWMKANPLLRRLVAPECRPQVPSPEGLPGYVALSTSMCS